ncbi:MAG TPA: hypothetical protein VF821_34175, partial [Lentzea sp.]
MSRPQHLDHARQQRSDGHERTDAHHTGHRSPQRSEISLGSGQLIQNELSVRGQHVPSAGQNQLSPVPFDQSHTGLAFQSSELLGDRRRGHVQGLGSGRDRAVDRQSVEQPETPHIQHKAQLNVPSRTSN